MVPANVQISTHVGRKYPHELDRKSRCRLVTIMTNRSNHIPMLVVMEMMNITGIDRRIALIQKSCGINTLQVYIDHAAHQYGPKARFQNVNRSEILPLYQAMKNSQA